MTRRMDSREQIRRRLHGRCANGCDAPVQPPSLVLCEACLDKIGEDLRALLARLEGRRG